MAKFSLEFIIAVNEWQQGGNEVLKKQRGQTIKRLAAFLEQKFRECDLVVYRRIALNKDPLWDLLAEGSIGETISAWTVSSEAAKKIKKGVPKKGQGIIFSKSPDNIRNRVVLNLEKLYRDAEFLETADKLKGKISGYQYGIGKYGPEQYEVIIEQEFLSPVEIHALGGFSSSPAEIGKMYFGRNPTSEEIIWMRGILNSIGKDFGAWWLEGQSKDDVLNNLISHVPRLKAFKAMQDQF